MLWLFFFFSKGGHEINAFSDLRLSVCYAHESETDIDESTLAYTLAVMAGYFFKRWT